MSDCPAIVTSRGLYASEAAHCYYLIQFKDHIHNILFPIELIAPTTWHFNADEPAQSYFEKKVGEELVRFTIADCIVQRVNGHPTSIVCDNYIQGFNIGLGRVPSDLECYTAIVEHSVVNDDDLLARKRENQRREKNNELPETTL